MVLVLTMPHLTLDFSTRSLYQASMTTDDGSDRCTRCGSTAWETGLQMRACQNCGAYEVAFGKDDWVSAGAREAEAARGAGRVVVEAEYSRGGPASRSAERDTIRKFRNALLEIEELAEDRADVSDGQPNAWMQVMMLVKEALP